MQSRLIWEAEYNDGSVVTEAELGTTDLVDRDRLTKFTLRRDSGELVFSAFFDPHRKLIFRRRVFAAVNGEIKDIVYLVGWHNNVNGVSIKSICYIYSDGHVEFDDSRNDLELTPQEQ
jgi:hypothetical protein